VKIEKTAVNIIDAAAQGGGDGLHLCLNIAAMLSLFSVLNRAGEREYSVGPMIPCWIPASMEQLFGIVFRGGGVACLASHGTIVHRSDNCSRTPGHHEFIAFIDLGNIKQHLTPKSFTIATYALCGFANFSSMRFQVGLESELSRPAAIRSRTAGMRAVAAGTMANFMSHALPYAGVSDLRPVHRNPAFR